MLARVAAAAGLLVAGGVVGLAAVALYDWWWGLALGAAATLGSLLVLPRGWLIRLPYAAGWVLVLAEAMVPRPAGSYAVGRTPRGYALLGVGLAVILLTAATLPLGRRVVGRGSPG